MPQLKEEAKEGVNEVLPELVLDKPDSELIAITNTYQSVGIKTMKGLKEDYEKNKKYYKGKQGHKDKISDNRIFLSLETIVPIATASTPAPNVIPPQDTIESIEGAKMWEKVLIDIFNKKRVMQKRIERAVRHLLLSKYAVFKYLYNPITQDIETRVISPDRIIFDNNRDIEDGFNWVGEKITKSAKDVIELYAKEDKKLAKQIKAKVRNDLESSITYIEWWNDETLIVRFEDLILLKSKNPNYDWEGRNNFFNRAKHPYIPINLFDLGDTIAGSTSLPDQARDLQDGVNKRKIQIDENADIVNGKIIATGSGGLTKGELEGIDWTDPKEMIFMSKGETSDIKRESGAPLPQFVQIDMQDSRDEIDNIMGTHSTTRGERQGRETATGRQLLRESDTGRIDLIGRRMEEAVELLFEGWTQLVKVYFGKKRIITIIGEDRQRTFGEFNRDSIEEGLQIRVIPGTLIPEDKASRQQKALTLANSQLIDPISLFEDLGYKNPEKRAERLYQWLNDPIALFPELQQGQQGGDEGSAQGQVQQANEENQAMAQGEPQPPFEQADANHISAHEQFMSQPQFKELDPKIQEIFFVHIEAEAEAVQNTQKENL